MLEVASLGGLAVPFGLGIRAAHHCIYIVAAVTDIYDFTSKKTAPKTGAHIGTIFGPTMYTTKSEIGDAELVARMVAAPMR